MHCQMRQAHAAPAINVISYNPKRLPFVITSNYYRTVMLYKSSIHSSHHIVAQSILLHRFIFTYSLSNMADTPNSVHTN